MPPIERPSILKVLRGLVDEQNSTQRILCKLPYLVDELSLLLGPFEVVVFDIICFETVQNQVIDTVYDDESSCL